MLNKTKRLNVNVNAIHIFPSFPRCTGYICQSSANARCSVCPVAKSCQAVPMHEARPLRVLISIVFPLWLQLLKVYVLTGNCLVFVKIKAEITGNPCTTDI